MSGRPNYARGLCRANSPRGVFTGNFKKDPIPKPDMTDEQIEIGIEKYMWEVRLLEVEICENDDEDYPARLRYTANQIRIVILFLFF
jgi:hypothetical protein